MNMLTDELKKIAPNLSDEEISNITNLFNSLLLNSIYQIHFDENKIYFMEIYSTHNNQNKADAYANNIIKSISNLCSNKNIPTPNIIIHILKKDQKNSIIKEFNKSHKEISIHTPLMNNEEIKTYLSNFKKIENNLNLNNFNITFSHYK